jgi:hypothetical protein
MLPVIAIPTFRRANLIAGLTLKFLREANYPPYLIRLFVASEEEKQLYETSVPRLLYYEIVVGVQGLKEQRNFISNYFAEDELVLQMDDDIKGIKTVPLMTFTDLVLKGVHELDKGLGLWGIMPNDDGRKMKEETTTHLSHIIGCFFLCRNHKSLEIGTTEKEDFERSILYFQAYGGVARYKGAGVATAYEKTPGGLQDPDGRRSDRQLEGLRYMSENYSEYIIGVNKTKGQDIILNWRAI